MKYFITKNITLSILLSLVLFFSSCVKEEWPTNPPDYQRPNIIETNPAAGSIMIPTDEKIKIKFSEKMDIVSIRDNVKIYKDNDTIAIKGKWEEEGEGIYSFIPDSPFDKLSRYTIYLNGAFDSNDHWKGPGIKDVNGNSIKYDYQFFFSTIGTYGRAPFYLGRGNPDNPSAIQKGIGVVKNFETNIVGNFENEGSLTVELTPNGNELFVASEGDNAVFIMETSNSTIISKIEMPEGVEGPWFVTFTPDGSEAWVLCKESNDVVVINTASKTVKSIIHLADYCKNGAFLYKMAIDHAGKKGYISTRTGQSVIVLDVVNKSFITNIENVVSEEATGEIIVLPDDSKVLVCNNWASPSFRIIDPINNTVESELSLGEGGDAYFMDISDNYLYMAGRWGGYIYKIDLNDFSIVAEINVAEAGITDEMQDIAVDADKQVVYVVANTYNDGAVLIFRTSDLVFLGAINTGPWRNIVVKK